MRTKDCFYGQVRAVTETWNGFPNTWAPSALGVTKQCGVTWDNATGMNPLFNKATVPVEHHSYGMMIAQASTNGYHFVNDFIVSGQNGDHYDKMILANYQSHYARLAMNLAIFWGVHAALSQPDSNDFDFVVVRQFDTWWKPENAYANENIIHMLNEAPKRFSAGAASVKHIPTAWMVGINLEDDRKHFMGFPVIGTVRSTAMVFNHAAVALLKDYFFQAALEEMEMMYKQANTDLQSNLQSWQPGYNIHRILTKFNIHTIDIYEYNVIGKKPGWDTPGFDNFSHTERATGASN